MVLPATGKSMIVEENTQSMKNQSAKWSRGAGVQADRLQVGVESRAGIPCAQLHRRFRDLDRGLEPVLEPMEWGGGVPKWGSKSSGRQSPPLSLESAP